MEWRGGDQTRLLTGYPLATAEQWLENRGSDLSGDERSYIDASIDWRNAQRRKATRVKRLIVGGAVSAGVVIIGALIYTLRAKNATTEALREAEQNYTLSVQTATLMSTVVKDQLLPDSEVLPRSLTAETLLRAPSEIFTGIRGHETPEAASARLALYQLLWKNFVSLDDWSQAAERRDPQPDPQQIGLGHGDRTKRCGPSPGTCSRSCGRLKVRRRTTNC